jgi:membrane dipeptidase
VTSLLGNDLRESNGARRGARLVDGLIVRSDGWTEDLGASGLSAMHVTAGDFLGDFDEVCTDIGRWHRILREESDRLFHVQTPADLDRVGVDPRVGVIFGLQNAAPAEQSLDRVDALTALGVRVIQLTYNDGNLVGDGCLEDRNAPLTRNGRELVERCNELGVLVDLSHVGRASLLDAVNVSTSPVVLTHANRSATAPSPRNKDDEALRAVAATGGIVGVTPFGPLIWDGVNKPTAATFVRQVHEMLDLLGEDSVAIGSDYPVVKDPSSLDDLVGRTLERFPGFVGPYATRFGNDITARYAEGLEGIASWSGIPGMLRDSGLRDEVVDKVCGENWLRLYRDVWSVPGSTAGPGAKTHV